MCSHKTISRASFYSLAVTSNNTACCTSRKQHSDRPCQLPVGNRKEDVRFTGRFWNTSVFSLLNLWGKYLYVCIKASSRTRSDETCFVTAGHEQVTRVSGCSGQPLSLAITLWFLITECYACRESVTTKFAPEKSLWGALD